MRMLPPILLQLALASVGQAYVLAERAIQNASLEERAPYIGGWALISDSASCPASLPTVCASGSAGQACCPSGNSCFSFIPYCCPSATDCYVQLVTFPVCADLTANMYKVAGTYSFCCANGLIGVIPVSGNGGICVDANQVIPVSRLATMVSQNGGTSVTPFGGFATITASGQTVTVPASITSTLSPGQLPPTSTRSTSTPTATSTPSSSSTSSSNTLILGLSTGQIVGIAIGAFFLFIIISAIVRQCRKPRVIKPIPAYRNVSTMGYANQPYIPYQPESTQLYDPVTEQSAFIPRPPQPAPNRVPVGSRSPAREPITRTSTPGVMSPLSPTTPAEPAPPYTAGAFTDSNGQLSGTTTVTSPRPQAAEMNAQYVYQERHEFDAVRPVAEVEGGRPRAEVDGSGRYVAEIDGRMRDGAELPGWDRTHGRAEM